MSAQVPYAGSPTIGELMNPKQPDPVMTFESFITVPSNQHAFDMASTLADKRCSSLLVITGNTGSGKTHLLNAVGIKGTDTGRTVYFVSAGHFFEGYISALQQEAVKDYVQLFEPYDLLLIDDIHYLDGKARLRDEFLSFIGRMLENGTSVGLAGEPSEELLACILPSNIAAINAADDEGSLCILKHKAKALNVELSTQQMVSVLNQSMGDVRKMEGALKTLLFEKE